MKSNDQLAQNKSTEFRLESRGIPMPDPWQAVVMPVSQFPMSAPQFGVSQVVLDLLSDNLTKQGLHQEVMLQVWKLSSKTGAPLVSANAGTWSPILGLGVWPRRPPPSGWSNEKMMDASAAYFKGDEPQLPAHKLMRLTGAPAKRREAAHRMHGFGVKIQAFSKAESDTVLSKARHLYLPGIKEERFQKEAFYFPLIDGNTLLQPISSQHLDACMCGIDLYVRESAEDQGILIVSRLPLSPLFEQIQATSMSQV